MVLRRGCSSIVVAAAFCGTHSQATGPAVGADLGPQPGEQLAELLPPPSQWQFSFTPYLW